MTFLPHDTDNTLLVEKHDALCQRASHNLVLYVCFLEECILDDSGKRNSLFHQSGRNPHRVRRGAAVLEYAGIGHNTGVQRLGARLGDLFFLQSPNSTSQAELASGST